MFVVEATTTGFGDNDRGGGGDYSRGSCDRNEVGWKTTVSSSVRNGGGEDCRGDAKSSFLRPVSTRRL